MQHSDHHIFQGNDSNHQVVINLGPLLLYQIQQFHHHTFRCNDSDHQVVILITVLNVPIDIDSRPPGFSAAVPSIAILLYHHTCRGNDSDHTANEWIQKEK